LKRLNNKLTSALSDCNAKDELVKKQTKVAQEVMEGSVCVYLYLCVFIYLITAYLKNVFNLTNL